jgi:hypothetical protein
VNIARENGSAQVVATIRPENGIVGEERFSLFQAQEISVDEM